MLERDLAEQLGIAREQLRKIRTAELIENRHYIRTAQGILLKGDGLKAMRKALDSRVKNGRAPATEKSAAPPAAGNGPQKEALAHLPKKFARLQ